MNAYTLAACASVFVATMGIAGYALSNQDADESHHHEVGDMLASSLVTTFEPTEESIELGATIFAEGSCVKCHKPGGVGGGRAPDLTDDEWHFSDGSFEGIRRTIALGVPEELKGDEYPFAMHPMGKMALDHKKFHALASYVWSLSH